MRIRRKRKSERKRELREKYKREELKKKRIINDELKNKDKKGGRGSGNGLETSVSSISRCSNNRTNYSYSTKSRKVDKEYYRVGDKLKSEKLDHIRDKKNKLKQKEELKRASQKRKKRFKRFTRPIRRIEKTLITAGNNTLKQTVHAPDKVTRMMQDDFDAMGVVEKGMVYFLKKVTRLFAKVAVFLLQSAIKGFLLIFGPAIALNIIVVIFLIYIINWSPFSSNFAMDLGATLSGSAEQEEEFESTDIYTFIEGRLRFRTVSIMLEKQEENSDAELTAEELTEEVVYGAVVVTYAIASGEEIYGSDILAWINSEEGTEKIDELAKDMVYVKKDKIKYYSLDKIKEMDKYEEFLSDIEAYEEVVKEERDD